MVPVLGLLGAFGGAWWLGSRHALRRDHGSQFLERPNAGAGDVLRASPPRFAVPVSPVAPEGRDEGPDGNVFRFADTADRALATTLRGHLGQLGALDAEAEARYQRGLEALRSRGDEVQALLASEYRELPLEAANARWALVETMGELRHPHAAEFFDRVLTPGLEGALGPDPRSGREVMIGMAAVRGLEALAATGDQAAVGLLRRHAISGRDRTVRIQAAIAFIESAGYSSAARAQLRADLPPGDGWIAEVRRDNGK